MKFKTTRKAVVSGSNNIIQVGYCAAWHLLKNHEPIAYTSGMYGWNFDVYQVYGVTICTGYRNMPGRAAKDLTWFEQEARAIYEKREMPYEQRSELIEGALKCFCEKNGGHIY